MRKHKPIASSALSANVFSVVASCILGLVLVPSLLIVQVGADRFSGLCPSGYPRRVAFNGTGRCYPVGSQGPCGKMMLVASDPRNSNFGQCRCKSLGGACFGRPILEWENRCYFEFTQGPCRKGHWLVRGKYNQPTCHKSPCPVIENQREMLRADLPRKNFYFTLNNNFECYMTGTQAFCDEGRRAYFLGSEPTPRCLNYEPWDCDYYSGAGAGSSSQDSSSFVLTRQGDPRPAPGFGVPYDDI